MNIEVDTVKGFRDFLPPESLKREAVVGTVKKYFEIYGFMPIETPVIEFDELMRTDNLEEEDEAISDRFKLKDRAGRNLGLRYEFTFQLARIFKQNPNIKLPFKRYQIGYVFRDEPTGPNRFRQFTQCDVDIIGESSTKLDAECLVLVTDIFKELKVKDFEIQINNRKLLNSIIESVEINASKQVLHELDKLTKIGEDQVKANLRKFADSNKILTLFKLLEKDLSFFRDNAFDGAKDLGDLQVELSNYGIKVKINPMMIRGLGYYTGNIFEVIGPDKNTIAGGGRYDKVVGKYAGKELPAVGISFGLERVCQLANITPRNIPSVLVISIEKDKESSVLLRKIRKSGISSIMFSDKPGKALEYANSLSIPYVIFIGEDEVSKERFKLRDMLSGEEKDLTEKQVLSFLKKFSLD
ncbi:histidine--tRNA ligase [Candidatus Pacearchaeota archaeon]|nr:histidine--tRNA ligase [Candidatus Pacearchaeota archaeon]